MRSARESVPVQCPKKTPMTGHTIPEFDVIAFGPPLIADAIV
jgi:hypothetical protein